MTSFSIASAALSSSASDCDFHGSQPSIFSCINCSLARLLFRRRSISRMRGTYCKEVMYQFNLFIHSERLLCEIRQETSISLFLLDSERNEKMLYLLRYLAIGSALFILKSFRNPEKLNVGSCPSTSFCISSSPLS